MCIRTIIDEICSIEWDIVPCDGMEDQADEAEIEHARNFFNNPNTNVESFEQVFIKMPVRDLLEVNSGVLNKVYNLKEEMVEVVARDGATFTKNPDIHGMYTNRDDIILPNRIVDDSVGQELLNPYTEITASNARERAAYFQYGWIAGPIPVPFGKKEIIWIEGMKRTDDHYGWSPVQTLAKSLQMLLYTIESDLEYYNDNNVPKGIIGIDGGDADEIKSFKEQWFDVQQKKDEFGNWKKDINKVPIVNKIPEFKRIEFSATEMQTIEKSKFYLKMVWASFGVTGVELGYTEDAKGSANQIVQSKVFRKKAINPVLRLLENAYNQNILSEFGFVGTVKTESGKTITRPKYRFVFKKFDVDEEKNKYELYKLQTESGLRTINEVRKDEGLDDVEWGDQPPREWMGGGDNFYEGGYGDDGWDVDVNDSGQEDVQDKSCLKKKTSGFKSKRGYRVGKKRLKGKYADEAKKEAAKEAESEERCKENCEKQDDDEEETKALNTGSDLILKEGETLAGSDRAEELLKIVLQENKQQLLSMFPAQTKGVNVKDFNDIINKLKGILSVQGLKAIVQKFVKDNYLKGLDQAEQELNRNILPDDDAIRYLDEYTFDLIKDMNADLENKLRQTLQRAFMNADLPQNVMKEVDKIFEGGMYRAEMITRTESNRAANFGRLHGYMKSGEPGLKKYSAHIDNRTSPLCKRLQAKYGNDGIPLGEKFVDSDGEWEGMVPPAHPNCRSSWTFEPLEKD